MKAVIISAVRTPIGKFLGQPKEFSAPQLGAIAAREAVARAKINASHIEDTIMGQVVTAGIVLKIVSAMQNVP